MTEIYVKVEPGNNEFKAEKGYMPKFYLESEAENNKANMELVRRIESITGEKPAIISGHKSRRKKIKVSVTKDEFNTKIGEYNG